jgi:cation diffusion facilitator CzcD-associated flavoprotein CzcO
METCYYETFNRNNVTLVDVRRAPIKEVTETGVRTVENVYDLDVIVLALGFDSFTGALLHLGITGRNGLSLEEAWGKGPRTYLGLASHGFPNLFMIAGPQSPAPLTNGFMAVEEHVEFISGAIAHTFTRGLSTIEPSAAAQQQWCEQVDAIAEATLIVKVNSWMMGTNIPGKPRAVLAFLAGAPAYRQICADVVANAYRGFDIT